MSSDSAKCNSVVGFYGCGKSYATAILAEMLHHQESAQKNVPKPIDPQPINPLDHRGRILASAEPRAKAKQVKSEISAGETSGESHDNGESDCGESGDDDEGDDEPPSSAAFFAADEGGSYWWLVALIAAGFAFVASLILWRWTFSSLYRTAIPVSTGLSILTFLLTAYFNPHRWHLRATTSVIATWAAVNSLGGFTIRIHDSEIQSSPPSPSFNVSAVILVLLLLAFWDRYSRRRFL